MGKVGSDSANRGGGLTAITACLLLAWAGAQTAHAQSIPAPARMVTVYAGTATPPAATVTVSPANVTLQAGSSVQFSAAVSGTSNTSLVWTATGGTITATGQYTANQTTGSYTVTATLKGGTISGSTKVTVQSGQSYVDIKPGENIQERINALPASTAFRVKAGVHRLSAMLTPKDGNSFVGETGAVLSGGRLLTNFTSSGATWVANGQTQQGPRPGPYCWNPRCNYPEDLYIDNVMLKHVETVGEVKAGTWHFDYAADLVYIPVNPAGHTVETTVTRNAFGGAARNVTIADLTIEKFANPAQEGAIAGDAGNAWVVRGNEIRFNHGVGVRIGNKMRLIDNNIHHNGQMGIGGIGDDVLAENNEIAYNNTAGYQYGWEAGGTKFVMTHNLIVRNNWSHHNQGPGLWTDIDNMDTLYEGNLVEDNMAMGIFHEISYAAIIRNNTVRRNALGTGPSNWLWGAGIAVAASRDVEVYSNTVTDNGDGITAVQQKRGSGRYGAWEIRNLWVHDNEITMSRGASGLAQDIGDNTYYTGRNNRFSNNRYKISGVALPFHWMNQEINEAKWREYGQDTSGVFQR